MVLDGVVADRERSQVQLRVEATGLPPGDTPEFIIIDAKSSHGYEAIFWSMAKPSDVGKALEFIGLESGGAVDPAAMRFWAQGDPVHIALQLPDEKIPVEHTIFDKETGRALEEEGFIFTGSLPVTLPDTGSEVHYAADVYDPRSIAPLYNEPASVLDIPRQAHQGEVYGRYAVNPDHAFSHGDMFTLTIEPAGGSDRPQQQRFLLSIRPGDDTESLLFELHDEVEDELVTSSHALKPVLEKITEDAAENRPPRVRLDYDPEIQLTGLSRLARLLAVMESFNQIRVSEPLEDQFFYRAFVPSERWKAPAGRPTQPWELHVRYEDDAVSAELILHEEQDDPEAEETFKVARHPVEDVDDVARIIYRDAAERELEGRMGLPAVVLVFAHESVSYGTLRKYLEPVLDTHGTIYIFVEEEEKE